MYWGKSFNQCDIKACFDYQFDSQHTSNQHPKRFKNNSGSQSPLSPKRKEHDDTVRSDLGEKKSLRKYASPQRNPETSSVNSSIPDSASKTQHQKYFSPQRKSHHRSPNNEVFYARQQLTQIQNQLKNIQTLETQSSPRNYQRRPIWKNVKSNTQRTFDNLKLSVVSQLSPQKNFRERNFEKKQTIPVFYQNSYQNYSIPNEHLYRNSREQQNNQCIKSPVKFTYQSPQKPIIQKQSISIIQPPIIVSPRSNIQNYGNKQNSQFSNQQQSISPIRRIQSICVKNEFVSQQFPTIREENQLNEQSRTVIDSKHQFGQKSQSYHQHHYQEETHKILQRQSMLKEIIQILHSETEVQPRQVKEEYLVLSPCEEDQESVIQPSEYRQSIDISCEELLVATQKRIVQQNAQNEDDAKPQQSLIQNMIMNNYSLSPSEQYCYTRRPKHLPSIAIKVIENKIRSHNYQISELYNSEKILANNSVNQSHQSDQHSQQVEIIQIIEDSKQVNNRKTKNQTESRWKKIYQQQQNNNQTNAISKEVYFPFNIRVEECKSEWITDGKIPSKSIQEVKSSLIDKLTNEKGTQKVLRNEKVIIEEESFPQRQDDVNDTNVFKDKTNKIIHVTAALSDRTRPPPPARKEIQKKFKTLINKKVTIHSIVQEDSYPSQVVKTSIHCDDHFIQSKYQLDDLLNGELSYTPTSHLNIERDQSTVIDKVTFQPSEKA